jgi:hypothetical protein
MSQKDCYALRVWQEENHLQATPIGLMGRCLNTVSMEFAFATPRAFLQIANRTTEEV